MGGREGGLGLVTTLPKPEERTSSSSGIGGACVQLMHGRLTGCNGRSLAVTFGACDTGRRRPHT